ncbi:MULTISPECIES: hypothetical protein [unclassified Microcoleus]|nr:MULTISPECIES: hypothetical protein [unclassified Microcoleus]
MQNTCWLWGQSFHLPTEVERILKENWRLFVGTSIPGSLNADRL